MLNKRKKMPELSRLKRESLWRDVWRRLVGNKMSLVALILVAIIVLSAVFADLIVPYDYAAQDYKDRFAYPSMQHLCGTDNYGRDIFSRIIKGGQVSLGVSLCAVATAVVFGVILGVTAGYFGGIYSTIVMRCMDILMGIPPLLLTVAISAALGSGMTNTVIAVAIGSIPTFVRTVYASTLQVQDKEYLEAATVCGAKSGRKMFKHILPNITAPIIVAATLRIGLGIMTISSLSFIGLGVQPPTPEWGSMMSAGRQYIRDFYPIILFPGIAIALTVVVFNLLGDGLRDALDPRMKH